MMKYTAAVLTLLSVAVAVSAEETADPKVIPGKLNVHRYEGPKDCDDDDKIMAGKFVKMHYTGSIHESSEAGEKGKKFDSSLDRGNTFDFQVGVGQVIKGCVVVVVVYVCCFCFMLLLTGTNLNSFVHLFHVYYC